RSSLRLTAMRSAITNLSWRRERNGWLLIAGRRRFGRVVPAKHSGMWQSTRSDGQPSDIANLSWAKNAVLVAAELELQFEDRQRRAIDPQNARKKGGVLRPQPRPSRQRHRTGIRCPRCVRVLARLTSDKRFHCRTCAGSATRERCHE